ncbi:M48 family metalloprotease [Thermanaerosceptrum fracticalcis]|jgi:heat shock protein HtpX|uniref:M48 family metalloprotease n=1 Tax=Thermanaerosceptrum fracticalcis TaxID=1712410 RepID=A0A7G6DZY5_THEFR|nr:zinc metalloprotease HtpX [Thermanaerosceptrum fracticalcis]QNB45389.1 M48 family metalloprotease [Thermanaerosceptrum fracticalcis]
MYLVEFLQRVAKKSNAGTIIYLILNILIITYLFSDGFNDPEGFLFGIAAYAVSLAVALSPVGEFILRLVTGCRDISTDREAERLQALFKEVHSEVKKKYPELPDDIKLFVNDNPSPNAFAIGRKTVCLNKGILGFSDEQIKGIFAHELAHLAHKDTDLLLVITIGNFIITAIFFITRVFLRLTGTLVAIVNESFGAWITTVLLDLVLVAAMALWTKLGVLLVMYSSRQNEYEADKLAAETGYGENLISALTELKKYDIAEKGILASLAASHPDTEDRIAKLKQLLAGGV